MSTNNPLKLPAVKATDPGQNQQTVSPPKDVPLPRRKYRQLLHEKYVKSVAQNLSFSEDVVDSMVFYGTPLKQRGDGNIFDLFKVVTPPEPHKLLQSDQRSRRCKLNKRKSKQGTVSNQKVWITCDSGGSLEGQHKPPSTAAVPLVEGWRSAASPLLEQVAAQGRGPPVKAVENPLGVQPQLEQWDEYLVKKLSKRTAQWLVTKQIPKGPSRARLQALLQDRYGSAHAHALIQDEIMTTSDFSIYDQIKPQEPRQAVVRKMTRTPLANYYRVPGCELHEDIVQEPGAVNRTAANLKVKHMELPPKPKTILNSKLGKHVYYTENVFEQELYAGSSRVVHHHGEKYKERIIMDSLSEYQKHLQERFPQLPAEWSEDREDQDQQRAPPGPEKVCRGLRRWTALPTLADYTMEKGLRLPDYGLMDKPMKKSFKTHEDLQVMRNMVTEWIKAWRIYSHWQDVTLEELERDLRAMHSHVQLNALATCASGATERPQLEFQDSHHLYSRGDNEVQAVPEALQSLISEALSSGNKRVRLAAAICHVTMKKMNEKVNEILQDTLLHGDVSDRWIAAQSLAVNGDDSYPVVNRIIQHLFETPDAQTVKQVCLILGPLSEKTPLVHFILANQLNSHNWKDKVLACRILSYLRGSLNTDLTHKIVYLMWNDWNSSVRQAAMQSLGALGLGKKVHDELRERLDKGDSRTRIEALSYIGQLGVMSGKLMPSFLDCFKDDFIGVRREACLTAGLLKLKDEQVLDQLLRLMQSDHIWKVKAYAIKALGAIGHVTEELKDLLLWALHYENEPGIRMEACNTIVSLNLQDVKVQTVLREQLLVESDPLVWKDVRLALLRLGGSTEVEGMLQKIKEQVHSLCQKDVVLWKLLRLEKVKLNVSQQVEWINLKTQPEHLKMLKEQIQQLLKNMTAPIQTNRKNFKECEAEVQSVMHSSCPAASLTRQEQSAQCPSNISRDDLQYSRALRSEGSKQALSNRMQPGHPREGKGSLEQPHLDLQMAMYPMLESSRSRPATDCGLSPSVNSDLLQGHGNCQLGMMETDHVKTIV
ncbi:HEAT repeat-containing protein 4 [Pristis pectinata]|uniref:HEAT repeat-containing protein 4 n=1 Tax=Pristis pectinata TaxID=685728 RepID=UPI00223DB31C|nr:HEAT repeat-containing protein 4 [Pristis pectinata]